jgi:hypothetical protein
MELRVRKATAEMADGSLVDDDPKSRAGIRPISLPAALGPTSNGNSSTSPNRARWVGCSSAR